MIFSIGKGKGEMERRFRRRIKGEKEGVSKLKKKFQLKKIIINYKIFFNLMVNKF